MLRTSKSRNISISKEDLGNGQTRWTVTFFPKKGLQNVGSKLSGLSSAKFGIALTSDYQIVGNVDMKVISDPNQIFDAYTFEPGSTSATEFPIQNLKTEKDFSFNPKTDVDPNTGLINSETMPAYNNQYLQPSYYFTTATDIGKKNLWQTYFKDADERKNAYDGSPYLGGNHDFHFNTFKIANETGVDGAKYNDPLIYDTRGGVNGVFSSDNFTQAMEFKSQGVTNTTQFSSYVISFTTQHTDSHEVELATGSGNQQFSGISANIYSFQDAYTSKMSSLYGEQRALDPAGAPKTPKDVISGWVDATRALDEIKKDYLNNAQINVLRNKILNNITDSDAVNNIIKEGNSLNDAMKNLGNSIGQYDPHGSFADHKVDKTKASDRYQYADSGKKSAYDTATDAVSNIISVENGTVNKNKGIYADQATVEQLTNKENTAWTALDGVKPDADKITPKVPDKKVPVADTHKLTDTEKGEVKKNVEDANKGNFPDGTVVTVGDDGTATITYPDQTKSTDTIPGDKLVEGKDSGSTSGQTDADKITPKVPDKKVPVADTHKLTDTEKGEVKKNVEDANKGNFPDGTVVTVGDDGTATVTYPDGSKDTIPGSDLVRQSTDADKTTPSVPGTKVPVTDPSHLTDTEKDQVKTNVTNANKDTLPSGSQVTVGNDGTTTITYPDGSKDTIPGSDLVRQSTDADKTTPSVPEAKVPVTDPSHLTDSEKDQVKTNVTNDNKDNLPSGSQVTVGDDGTATVTYPDGSKDTIPGSDLVRQSTDADKTTPSVPGTKVPVTDPSHLTDSERDQVKTNVTNDNKDNLPSGSQITVGDDGTATITYPDGSKDTIPGRDLIKGISGNKHDSNSSSGSNGTISNTDDETSGDTVNNAESMNGNTAKSGSKNNSLKTLPQTGTKDVTILEILGLFLSLFGLLGLKKKHHEE
ncbi:LEA family epithelial adhesin [Limosilactobacillus reuteri]|uniref:LEA family epithelial adhesin n=1 Tax=Limosilactobacillus reuteri TaxID=1598 RepID=UPI0015E023BD|nr:LEA family epithelial adhesin [Limosilactobacillus reuteri]QLL75256.1 LEA family epithelial adhesin [Limosilactobacillus reuteri]